MSSDSKHIGSIRLIYEISHLIRSDAEIVEIFKEALQKVRDFIGCSSASLFISGGDNGRLEEAATVGKRVELIESIDFDLGAGFSAWVAKQRRSVLIPNLKESRHKEFRSFVSTPLLSGDNLIGVMNLGHKEADGFSEDSLQFFEIIAEQFALLIERKKYEKELVHINDDLLRAQEEIKNQQKQLIEMEKYQAVAQMAASVNHEINNPLTTVTGNIELLLMSKPDMDPMIRSKLTIVLEEARRIADITMKLRNIKRVVVGDYLKTATEKMLDLNSSSLPDEPENLS
ncbi:GAF domain-containing protein [Candidatus Latescibacterota bacterium]